MTKHINPINPLLFKPGAISPTGEVSFEDTEVARVEQPELKTPSIITTEPVRNQFKDNVDALVKEEDAIIPAEVSAPLKEGEVAPPPPAITAVSANVAFQKIIDDTNKLLSDFQAQGGTLTPEAQERISNIQGLETRKDQALADARTATDKKDVAGQAEAMDRVEEAEEEERTEIQLFKDEISKLREQFVAGLAPSERNIELRRELQELRTERQLMPLELRKEGIPAAGIAGRIVEDERTRAIQEGNLLFELGLEQEAQQFKQASVEAQLKFIQDDVDLQFKIQDRLQKDEDRIVEQARDQRKEALDFMNAVIDEDALGGLAWEDLDAQTQSDLIKKAEEVGLDLSLLQEAMKNNKSQQIFDRSIKERIREVAEARERRLGEEIEEPPTEDVPTFDEFVNEVGEREGFPSLTPKRLEELRRAYDEEIAKGEVEPEGEISFENL